jgi:hypothetical protein
MKAAIVVISDPKGGEEALGRVFNALAATLDFKRSKTPVRLVFQGTGTRWPAALADAAHPAHGLYEAVKGEVAGASNTCAMVFGARDELVRREVPLLSDNRVPGTDGLASLAGLALEGYQLFIF